MSDHESRDEVTVRIKEQADIVQLIGEHVSLKRSGVRHLGLCPFHQEKTPSFTVHSGQQFFYCFGCGESGDVFTFLMKYHGITFPAALQSLAERYQITLPEKPLSRQQQQQRQQRQKLFELNAKVASLFRTYLLDSSQAKKARQYLLARDIDPAVQERYLLGYAPEVEIAGWNFLGSRLTGEQQQLAVELGLLSQKQQGGTYDRFRGRIMFPIHDSRGRIAGFGGRVLGDDQPKYLNSPESLIYTKSRLLFGLYQQGPALRSSRRAILVEGNFDLLSLVSNGFDSVTAPLGTALTLEQVRLLGPMVDEVILLFDGDSAGLKAAERAVPIFLSAQVVGKIALLPENHDPDTYIREKGREKLNNLVAHAETLPEFLVTKLVERYGLSLDGKNSIIAALLPLLETARSDLQKQVMAAHFASILNVEPQSLIAQSPGTVYHRSAPAVPVKRVAEQPFSAPYRSLTSGARRVLAHLIINPHHYNTLAESGLSGVLAGTIGEVVELQLKKLLSEGEKLIQPEDLLSAMIPGEEREFVAAILLEPPITGGQELSRGEPNREELKEIKDWLERHQLDRRSNALLKKITDLQESGDFSELETLLQQKAAIDNILKGQ